MSRLCQTPYSRKHSLINSVKPILWPQSSFTNIKSRSIGSTISYATNTKLPHTRLRGRLYQQTRNECIWEIQTQKFANHTYEALIFSKTRQATHFLRRPRSPSRSTTWCIGRVGRLGHQANSLLLYRDGEGSSHEANGKGSWEFEDYYASEGDVFLDNENFRHQGLAIDPERCFDILRLHWKEENNDLFQSNTDKRYHRICLSRIQVVSDSSTYEL